VNAKEKYGSVIDFCEHIQSRIKIEWLNKEFINNPKILAPLTQPRKKLKLEDDAAKALL
jgi:hypothetical protein